MMENHEQTMVEAVEPTCTTCMTIPVSHLALEDGIDVPLKGWFGLFDQMGVKILTDPAGRPAITTLAARQLLRTLRRRDELVAEGRVRMSKELAARRPVKVGGVPVVEGASPFESLVAAGGIVSPRDEFGGNTRPNFLAEELAEGQRAMGEKKREAAARAAQRLADQAKDKLGGKR